MFAISVCQLILASKTGAAASVGENAHVVHVHPVRVVDARTRMHVDWTARPTSGCSICESFMG